MTCLIKSMYTTELQQYTNILGSEAAAYYVLAMNNGFTLDKDLQGNDSQLWDLILSKYNGSETLAILYKSQIYTPEYLAKNGDWINNTGIEPDITQLVFKNSVDDILGDSDYEDLMKSLGQNDQQSSIYAIKEAIKKARQKYVANEVANASNNGGTKHRTFMQKLVRIFTLGKYNKYKILPPDQETLDNVDKAARFAFDQTLRSNILQKLINVLHSGQSYIYYNVSLAIQKFIDDDNTLYTVNAMKVLWNITHNTKCQTKDKPMLKTMLTMFEHTNLFQEGFNLFSKAGVRGKINLIKALSGELVLNPAQQRYINDFWDRFEKEIAQQYEETSTNITIGNELFSISEASNCIDMFFSLNQATVNQDQVAFDVIYNGLKSRLESVKRRNAENKNLIFSLEQAIKQMEQMNSSDLYDVYSTYVQFLRNAQSDLQFVVNQIEDWKKDGYDSVDPELLMYYKTDVIGYYSNVISKYLTNLRRDSNISENNIDDLIDKYDTDIKDILGTVINEYNDFLKGYTEHLIDQYIDENVDIGDKDKFKYTAQLWLNSNVVDGDMSQWELIAGLAQDSKSPIIRIMNSMLNDAEMDKVRFTNKLGHRLQDMYNKLPRSILSKLNPLNYQEALVSLDDDGKPTGFWIEETNKGLFISRYNKKRQKLMSDLGIKSDENGNPIFNYDVASEVDKWRDYNLQLNEWLGRNCHRMYTPEYYKLRYTYLTPKAIEKLNKIESQISVYTEKMRRKDGILDIRLLDPYQRSRFELLQRQKEDLGNPYVIVYDPITKKMISFADKTGEDLEIAKSIMNFKSAMKHMIKMTPDYQSFNTILNEITDSAEKDKFIRENTDRLVISSEFYDRVYRAGKSELGRYGQLLMTQRQHIVKQTKQTRGYALPDLTILNDDAWIEMKTIEEEATKHPRVSKAASGERIDDFAVEIQVTMVHPVTGLKVNVYDYFKERAQMQMQYNPNAMKEFEEKYTKHIYEYDPVTGTVVDTGRIEPLSIFSMLVPNSKYPQYIEHDVPSGVYSILDQNSPFADPLYDRKNNDRFQPDKGVYEDKRWKKYGLDDVNSPLRKLYDALRQTMKEANSKIPLGEKYDDGRLPQITETKSKLMFRNGVMSVAEDAWNANEKDEDIFQDFSTRPDGTRVESVPVRFVSLLKDPTKISTSVVSSVIQYAEMAENFDKKRKVLSNLEAVLLQLKGGINGTNNSKQISRAESLIDMYGYGKMTTYEKDASKKLTQKQKNIMKRVSTAQSIGSRALLAHNLFAAAKGFSTAFLQTGTEALIGKYYSKEDYARACWVCILDSGNAVRSFGVANTKSKVQAAMQRGGVAKSAADTFGKSDLSGLRKFTEDHIMMGEYTLGDYMTNGVILVATYMQYKLVENPQTGMKQFMNEDEYIWAVRSTSGKTEAQARHDFRKLAEIRLWDAYELSDNGEFVPKSNYEQYITRKLENRVNGAAKERAAIINGVITGHGKPAVYQNYISRLFTVMRGYLFTMGNDKFKDGNDYVEEYTTTNAAPNVYTIARNNTEYIGQYNFMTGRVERGQFNTLLNLINFAKYLRDKMNNGLVVLKYIGNTDKINANKKYSLSRVDRKNITRVLVDLMLLSMVCIATIFTRALKDDYPDSWWANFIATVNLGIIVELSTGYSPFTVLDVIQNATTLASYFQNITNLLDFSINMAKYATGLISGHGNKTDYFSEDIQTGIYEGFTPAFRDMVRLLLKPTGLGNLMENLGLQKDSSSPTGLTITSKGLESKYRYYSKNVFPLNTPLVRTTPNTQSAFNFEQYDDVFKQYDDTFKKYDNMFKDYDNRFNYLK